MQEVENMLYISKGIVCPESVEGNLFLGRGKQKYQLQGREAAVWLKGRFGFNVAESKAEEQVVLCLSSKGLAEMEVETGSVYKYRILTRCVCCPVKQNRRMSSRLSGLERQLDTWMRKAGIRLSVAELVFLVEHQVLDQDLLYEKNRQKLVETIYTDETIQDNLLEHQMEQAEHRDKVVEALVQLLKKKKILIV